MTILETENKLWKAIDEIVECADLFDQQGVSCADSHVVALLIFALSGSGSNLEEIGSCLENILEQQEIPQQHPAESSDSILDATLIGEA